MWSALRKDFTELVSTVREDTSSILTSLDTTIGSGGIAVNEETNDCSSIQGAFEDDQDVAQTTKSAESGVDTLKVDENGKSSRHNQMNVSEAQREAYRRMNMVETYLSPLILEEDEEETDDVSDKNLILEFIQSFQIDDSKQTEISHLVNENPILKEYFEELVPEHVSYLEFWQRYYYRCDVARIQNEIEMEHEAALAARAAAISKVSNFLGGAVDAVAKAALIVTSTAATAAPTTTKAENHKGKFTKHNDDDLDEELGWDDDDDDDLEVDTEPSNDLAVLNNEETIEFQDVALLQTKDELKLAIELRDQLHQTVELQKQEIMNLQHQLKEMKSPTSSTIFARTSLPRTESEITNGDDNEVILQLKLQLSETEAELEAWKQKSTEKAASVAANCIDDTTLLEEKCKQQQVEIELLQNNLNEAQSIVHAKNIEIDELLTAMQQRKAELDGLIDSLRGEVKFLNGNVKAAQRDSNSYVKELREFIEVQSAELATCKDEIKLLKDNATKISEEHEQEIKVLNEKIQDKDAVISKLEGEVTALKIVHSNDKKNQSPSLASSSTTTPDTITTGDGMIRIEKPYSVSGMLTETASNTFVSGLQSLSADGDTEPSNKASQQPSTVLLSATKIEDADDNSDWGDDWD